MSTTERIDLRLTDAHGSNRSFCSGSTAATPLAASDRSERTQIKVDGMTCSHCVASVTEELSSVDGVQEIAVGLNPGGVSTVTVLSTGTLDAERVRAAIDEAGYSLVETKG